MHRNQVNSILSDWSGDSGYLSMISALCEGAPDDTSPEALIAAAQGITFEMRPTTADDDDTYWLAQSPFDRKWYVFAAGMGTSGCPSQPAYVEDARPGWFDQN